MSVEVKNNKKSRKRITKKRKQEVITNRIDDLELIDNLELDNDLKLVDNLELNDKFIEKIKNNNKESKKKINKKVNIFKGITAMPYRGSKWKFRNQIKDGLKDVKFDDNLKIYDLFGGSGALSLIFKCICPQAQITLNDYDKIIEEDGKNKIDKSITLSNLILNEIRNVLKQEDIKREKIVNEEKIHKILDKYKERLDKDIISTQIVAANISFNGRYELRKSSYWNRLKKTDYDMYYFNFDGIKIVHKDYQEILTDKEIEEDNSPKLFLLDPPYLYTETTGYNMTYWKLSKYLYMLIYIFKHQQYKFILFEGKKSCLDDIFEFFEELNTIKLNYKRVPISKQEFMILINFD